MSIRIKKILRLLSKLFLAVVALALLGWGGYYVYRAVRFSPQNVVITNITDSSATVTWTTDSAMTGIVYYQKDKSPLPGPLGIIGSQKGNDDRDVSDTQKACVDAFNKKANETKSSDFSVSGDNYDCTNVSVTKMGDYYTHSVTITNLDESSTYYFVVGNGLWSFKEGDSNVKTFATLSSVEEPKPIFGKIVGDDNTFSRDSIAYVTFTDGSEAKDSVLYSSVTNDDGGWYLDASNTRDLNGTAMTLELTNDSFKVNAVYSNYGKSDEVLYVLGYFNGAYPDITVGKQNTQASRVISKYLLITYAKEVEPYSVPQSTTGGTTSSSSSSSSSANDNTTSATTLCNSCPSFMTVAQYKDIISGSVSSSTISSLGYGNVAKALANNKGGSLDKDDLNIVLKGVGVNAGNVNAIAGVTDGSNNEKLQSCLDDNSCSVTVDRNNKKITQENPSSEDNSGNVCTTEGQPCYEIVRGNRIDGTINDNCVCDTEYDSLEVTICNNGDENSNGEVCFENHYYTPSASNCDQNPAFNATLCNAYKNEGQSNTGTTTNCSVTYYPENFIPGLSKVCDIKCGDQSASSNRYSSCKKFAELCKDSNGNLVDINNTNPTASCSATFISNGVDLSRISDKDLAKLATDNAFSNYLTNLENRLVNNGYIEGKNLSEYGRYCKAQGKIVESSVYCKDNDNNVTDGECNSSGENVYKISCNAPSTLNIRKLANNVYAEEDSNSVIENSYSFYLPELGIYDFQLDNSTLSKVVSDASTSQILYVEGNGVTGFQMPAEPDNPTADEDFVLSTNAYQITYTQETTAKQYDIKKGINIISFDFIATNTDSQAYTAKDVIQQAANNGVEIQYITTFSGGRWSSGYSCSSGTCTGANFTITPGTGYLVYATDDGTITIPGYTLTSSIPVPFSAGWNLVGVHGYTTAYTARTFIDSINSIEGLTADNVTWWPTSKGKYEGISLVNGTQYGTDFALSQTMGYFVRISKFAPTDTSCKSLIWNPGGSLDGACGNTK